MRDGLAIYRRPYLAADRVERLPDGLRLVWQDAHLELAVEGALDDAAALIETLRQPDGFAAAMAAGQDLARGLDRMGWVRDAEPAASPGSQGDLTGIVARADAWIARTGQGDEIRACLRNGLAERALALDPVWLSRQDLALDHLGLTVSLAAIALHTPQALEAVRSLAAAPSDRAAPEPAAGTGRPVEGPQGSSAVSAHAVEGLVWTCVALAARLAGGQGAGPAVDPLTGTRPHWSASVPHALPDGSALDGLLSAERALERLLGSGQPRLLGAVGAGGDVAQRAAGGIFLHQLEMTTRWLVSVAAWLSPAMPPRLHRAILAYMVDEVGHEDHERDACLAVGLGEADMAAFTPLPLCGAYRLALDLIARTDPFAFGLCLILAEGLPGTRKPLIPALERQGLGGHELSAHQEIDEAGDHTMVSRQILSLFGPVSGDALRASILRFLLAARLSQTGWDEVAAYAARLDLPVAPRAFGLDATGLRSLTAAVP